MRSYTSASFSASGMALSTSGVKSFSALRMVPSDILAALVTAYEGAGWYAEEMPEMAERNFREEWLEDRIEGSYCGWRGVATSKHSTQTF